ncbi:MAG: hypothetical protein V2I76_00090 [Roseobacter sp.]|nr:hypothetical protein [Roseobacter sp.]
MKPWEKTWSKTSKVEFRLWPHMDRFKPPGQFQTVQLDVVRSAEGVWDYGYLYQNITALEKKDYEKHHDPIAALVTMEDGAKGYAVCSDNGDVAGYALLGNLSVLNTGSKLVRFKVPDTKDDFCVEALDATYSIWYRDYLRGCIVDSTISPLEPWPAHSTMKGYYSALFVKDRLAERSKMFLDTGHSVNGETWEKAAEKIHTTVWKNINRQ